MNRDRNVLLMAIPILALMLASECSVAGQAERPPASFPQAQSWLKKMSDYMGTLDRFQVHVQTTRELIFPKGGRIDDNAYGDIFVQRPNMLRADVFRPNRGREVYYDGTTLTVYTPKLGYYGSISAPPTIDQMLSMVMTEYGISIPLADVLRRDIYSRVMPQVDTGIVVGPSLLNGVYCKQLAFRSGTMDWQVWIEDSETPLPRRIVIVDRGVTGSPRYMATLTNWDTNPTIEDGTFTFTAPEGAQRIQFVKPGQAPAQPGSRAR